MTLMTILQYLSVVALILEVIHRALRAIIHVLTTTLNPEAQPTAATA